MADKKPPSRAPRKTPAKRGPTKAAALKALGLTQEDLAAIKELRELKELLDRENLPSPMQSVPQAVRDLVGHQLGKDHPTTGEGSNQGSTEPAQAPQSNPHYDQSEEPVFYARNLRHVDVGFRLTRQQKQGEKRTNLKPRGSRGDMIKLEKNDLKDPELQTQVSFGLIEVIPEGEALDAIKRQYTNAQQTIPAHIAALRNPLGKEYEFGQAGKMASDEEAFGIKVADLDPRLMQGGLSDKEIRRDGGFAQQNLVEPVQTPRPGRIISDGFMAPAQGDSAQLGNNDQRSQEVDALARSKQFEGPGAGLGNVTVKVEPVQKVH